jgi:rhamnosyltransferase
LDRQASPWRHRAGVFKHYLVKVVTLTIGAAVVSGPAEALRRWCDRKAPLPEFHGGVGLVAHVHYLDLLDEILACHGRLPRGAALIVTAQPDKVAAIEARLAGMAQARVVPCVNRGRDIAPFLTLLNAGALDAFDAVLKLHTKRSPHLRDGDIRRRLLFLTLAGRRQLVARTLALFEDRATGLVGWRGCWRNSPLFWMLNRARVEALARRMGIAPPAQPALFEGSMFWVRPAALARLRALALTPDDFEPEQGQVDGALHHAIERVFALAAIADGYVVRDAGGRRLLAPPSPVSRHAR